jgi:hypothetical protein
MKIEKEIIENDVPSYIEKEFKPIDIYAWIMSIIGMGLIGVCVNIPTFNTTTKWFYCITIAFFTLDYMLRILQGRVCRLIWYNTFLYDLYEIRASGKTFYICSPSEEELTLYMNANYKDIQYTIIDVHVAESFQKTEKYK